MSERFTFFWGGVFSQWHRCRFTVDGVAYNCAEQYMMHQKALLFGDHDSAAAVLASGNPKQQKALGRKVRNFVQSRWEAVAREVVYRGNLVKFGQNEELKRELLATAGTTLVEASPSDTIWGIGLAEDDPAAQDRSKWRGTNWLGEALTRVREEFLTPLSTGTPGERGRG